jgi:hypothetical protein
MSHEISTRILLQQLADGQPDDELSFDSVLDSFRHRSYGLFLLIVLIPVFIPIPAGQGAFSGLLTSLIGLQLMWQLEHPWIPKFIGRKTFKRSHIINFQRRFDPWLKWIEKLCKPRYEYAFDHAWARAFSGLLLLVLGILLALPIPLTNYPFGLIVLAFSLGFIERDGILLGIGWIMGLIEIVILAEFSGYIIALLEKFWAYLF